MATNDVPSKLSRTAAEDGRDKEAFSSDIVSWKVFWRYMNTRGYSYKPSGADTWKLLFVDENKIYQPVSWLSEIYDTWETTVSVVVDLLREDGLNPKPRFIKSVTEWTFPSITVKEYANKLAKRLMTPSSMDYCHVKKPSAAHDKVLQRIVTMCGNILENEHAAYLFLYQIGHILVGDSHPYAKPRNFVILEGSPGTGKSTFVEAFVKYIESKGYTTTQMPPLRAGFGWDECANSHFAYQDDVGADEILQLMRFPAFLSFISHNSTKSERKGKDHVVHENPMAAYLLLCNSVPPQIVNSPVGMLSRALILRVEDDMREMTKNVPAICEAGVRVFNDAWGLCQPPIFDPVRDWIEEHRKHTRYFATTGIVQAIIKCQYDILFTVFGDHEDIAKLGYSTAMLYYFMKYMDGFTSELSQPVLEQRIDALVKWYTLPGNGNSKPPQDALHNHILYKGVYVPTFYKSYLTAWENHKKDVAKNLVTCDNVELSAREKAIIARDISTLFGS